MYVYSTTYDNHITTILDSAVRPGPFPRCVSLAGGESTSLGTVSRQEVKCVGVLPNYGH